MQLRTYALILIVMLLVGCAVYLPGQLVLLRASETEDVRTLLGQQSETDGIYFGLAKPTGPYKLAAYAQRKPDIVILGSSRAHRQHQEFYTRSSYAMSGLVTSPDSAIQLLDVLIPIHKPKIVIYSVDFFSLCMIGRYAGSTTTFTRPGGAPQGVGWNFANQFAVVPKLIMSGALSPEDAADIAFGRFEPAPKGIHLYGLIAIMRHTGFRLDGAIGEVDARTQDAEDFEAAKGEILTGTKHYPAGCFYDPSAMANLEFLQRDMDRDGIKLVLLLPPISPTMYRLFMAAPEEISGYYRIWQHESAKRQFSDLHVMVDGSSIGAPDSEFADAVHGGDVSEARMLLKAAEAPRTVLAEIINRPFLERLVRERAGTFVVEMSYFKAADRIVGSVSAIGAR
jgi:hypothetical protein